MQRKQRGKQRTGQERGERKVTPERLFLSEGVVRLALLGFTHVESSRVEFSSWNSGILASSFPGNAAEFVAYADVNGR